jgi:hypothetical protein
VSYVLHSSAARRRRVRRRNTLGLAAIVSVILLALVLGWPRTGDHRLPRAGIPAGSPKGDSGALGTQDGYVAVGSSLSPFSEEPALAKLDLDLREALRQAADDALAAGIALRVNGGWRSPRYQRALLRRAVQTYGSIEAARQYVKPPDESSHVSGEAVDVGPADADSWLAQHGNEYGLCQIYANEPWHFELATTPGGPCPPMISNAAGG